MNAIFRQARARRVLRLCSTAVLTVVLTYSMSASAGHGALWGIGGLLAGHYLTDYASENKKQTHAMQSMAASQPSHVGVAPPAGASASSASSVEQKLNTLDQLAAKGYITKQEYQARRQALLNTL
jgi:hypothetical protein